MLWKYKKIITLLLLFLISVPFVSATNYVTFVSQDPNQKFQILPEDASSNDMYITNSILIEVWKEDEAKEYIIEGVAYKISSPFMLNNVWADGNMAWRAKFKINDEQTPFLGVNEATVLKNGAVIGLWRRGIFSQSAEWEDVAEVYFGTKTICGDAKCNSNETPNSCPQDCPPVCGDNLCSKDENCKKDDCCEGEIVNLKKDVKNCGKCGLECGKHENCARGVCVPICGDGYCSKDENCLLDNCCHGGEINFDNDANNCGSCGKQCAINERCKNGKCVTYCGNDICEAHENCSSCSSDCGCKSGLECSNTQCIKPECTANSDCSDGNACTTDICSGNPLKCSNKRIASGCSWDNKCVSSGTRIGNFYCSETGAMKIIEVTNSSCSNNYECETSICSDNKCKQPNIIKKTFNLLKRIFWFL